MNYDHKSLIMHPLYKHYVSWYNEASKTAFQRCMTYPCSENVNFWQFGLTYSIIMMIIIISYSYSAFSESDTLLDKWALIWYSQLSIKACSKNFTVPLNYSVLTFCLNFSILFFSLTSRGSAFQSFGPV